MMALLSSSISLQMALTATVYFIVVLTTCSTQECTLPIVEELRNRSVFLTKADIKLIQIKCMEESFRQSNKESKMIDKTDGPIVHQENQPKFQTESCGPVICNQTSKCVEDGHEKTCVEASTTDATEDVTPIKIVPPVPVTTKDPDAHATPSPATVYNLYNTSRDGDLESVKRILVAGHVDINMRGGQYSRTPVMAAARWGQRGVVELLVGRGADVSLVDKDGSNILLLACVGGDLETVKLILSLNVLNINSRGQYSWTPVMVAARWRHRGVVELLVGRGADMSVVGKYSETVLHLACFGGDLETVKVILSLNVLDINTRGGHCRRTPLMVAAWRGQRDVVEFLIGRGANMSLVDKDGHDILHVACLGGDVETVELILSLNVQDINAGGGYHSKTPMMMAVQERHRDLAEFLLGRGVDVALLDANGNNVLHYACFGGDLEIIKLILSLNVLDINAGNNKGQTAADWVRVRRHQQILDILVSHGAH